MSVSTILISNAVLICIAGICYLILRSAQKKHRKDPDFVRKQKEREAEYRRKMEEDRELEDIAYSVGTEEDDYSDDA